MEMPKKKEAPKMTEAETIIVLKSISAKMMYAIGSLPENMQILCANIWDEQFNKIEHDLNKKTSQNARVYVTMSNAINEKELSGNPE